MNSKVAATKTNQTDDNQDANTWGYEITRQTNMCTCTIA